MGGIMNGLADHGGVIPIGGTFFTFSDYMRGAVRLAALSEAHVIYSWTHDSVGLGEDGPTHQPIEQLAAMRAMPQLRTIRPADANEAAHALRLAIDSKGPTALILSRQSIPILHGTAEAFEGVSRGAYVLHDPSGADPQVILIGTGSEVYPCLVAADQLASEGDPRPGGVVPVLGAVRDPTRGVPGLDLHAPAFPAWRWRPPPPSGGTATPRRRCRSTISAPAPRGPRCSPNSDSPGRTWPPRPGPFSVADGGRAPESPDPYAFTQRRRPMTRLHDLYREQDQSPWLDDLKRSYLEDGTLAAMVDDGIRGVTSNPTIFAKAIAGEHTYDEEFAELSAKGTVIDAYWRLVMDDVSNACAPADRDPRRGRRRVRVARGGTRSGPRHRRHRVGGPLAARDASAART